MLILLNIATFVILVIHLAALGGVWYVYKDERAELKGAERFGVSLIAASAALHLLNLLK